MAICRKYVQKKSKEQLTYEISGDIRNLFSSQVHTYVYKGCLKSLYSGKKGS